MGHPSSFTLVPDVNRTDDVIEAVSPCNIGDAESHTNGECYPQEFEMLDQSFVESSHEGVVELEGEVETVLVTSDLVTSEGGQVDSPAGSGRIQLAPGQKFILVPRGSALSSSSQVVAVTQVKKKPLNLTRVSPGAVQQTTAGKGGAGSGFGSR